MKFASDVEQSRELKAIEDNKNPDFPTADMVMAVHWAFKNCPTYHLLADNNKFKKDYDEGTDIVRAWSLSRMIEALPPTLFEIEDEEIYNGTEYQLHLCPGGQEGLSKVYYADSCSNILSEYEFTEVELLDAVFKMIMHLKSNGWYTTED